VERVEKQTFIGAPCDRILLRAENRSFLFTEFGPFRCLWIAYAESKTRELRASLRQSTPRTAKTALRGPRLHTCLMHEDFPVAYKDTQLISAAWPPASSEAWLTWPSVSDERQLSVSAQVWLVRVAFPLLFSQQPSPSFEQLFPRSSAGHL